MSRKSGGPASDPGAGLRRLIRQQGPISVAQFMGESNALYYASRDPLGTAGDFVTAPEISQMFGELIGIWLVDMWNRAGRPDAVTYAELGPGRGSLTRDALGVMRRMGVHPQVHLIEASPVLRAIQHEAIPDARFHDDVTGLPEDVPLLLVANEFFDALPVRQLVKTASGWRERMIGLRDDRFVYVAGDQPMDSVFDAAEIAFAADAGHGTVVETCPGAAAILREMAGRLARQGGAGLVIDYGHGDRRTGSTLQAVRAHRKLDPLATPGEADLTCHVDFAALAEMAQMAGAQCFGPVGQGAFLERMGLTERARALAQAAPDRLEDLHRAHRRLAHPEEMGTLFKVLGVAAPDWPVGAGFFSES